MADLVNAHIFHIQIESVHYSGIISTNKGPHLQKLQYLNTFMQWIAW